MNPILLLPIAMSFFITFLIIPFWIKKAKKVKLEGKDMNKYNQKKVVEGGGISVVGGFIIGILLFIAIRTFIFESFDEAIKIFALTTSFLLLAGTGIIDDLLGWKKGLSRRFRILMCLFAAIPLIVINAGHSEIGLPILGVINLGIFYPFIIIPLGIVGAATTFNFIAGFNGLEAGQGILILSALSIVCFFTGYSWLALIGLCLVFSLIAFLLFNKFPAKVFPGDVLTYPVGGLIAIIAILGNMEKIALFFFIPYFLEIFLKLRGGLKKQSYGKPKKDGTLELAYRKIYGLEHLSIFILKKIKKNEKVFEKSVVNLVLFFQFVIIILGFIIFRGYIF